MIRRLISYSLFAMLLLASSLSYACDCIGSISVKKEIKISDAVFKGKIIEKSLFVVDTLFANEYVYKAKYKIELDVVYKGNKNKSRYITVITGIGSGDCGYEFKEGESYIIYAKFKERYFSQGNKVSKFLYTDICTRTTDKIDKEEKAIKECRKPCR